MDPKQIQNLIEGEVDSNEQTLEKYSTDASIFKIQPKLIACPKDSTDIEKLVQFINQHPELNLSITPRSAGTCMSGGASFNSETFLGRLGLISYLFHSALLSPYTSNSLEFPI